ncbi:MAG: tetratricopeptide repeat protein [Candidatus Acidiferrales bacterium]
MSNATATMEAPAEMTSGASPGGKPQASASPWIYGPKLDLLVGCGGWSAPLLLAAWIAASHARQWAIAFYALALIFNYPHFMATVYRAYHTREEFQKYRIFTLHLTALLALTAIFAHANFRLVPWIFTLYIDWSPWHYTGQNFGLLMMFVRRGGTTVKDGERRMLKAAFIASYVMLLASFHTGVSNDPLILSLNLPLRLSIPLRVGSGVLFVFLAGWVFARWIGRSGWKSMTAPLTLLLTQSLWFVLPTALEFGYRLAVPQTRYSSGILALLHSTQYLWITSYYARREARAAGNSAWRMPMYFATLIAGGIGLFIAGPWLVSYAFHYDFAVSFLIFTALVNIHHFMLDGAIWKLRDTRVSSLLVDRGEKRPAATARKSAKWLGGQGAGAHAFRVGMAALLFLLGGVDLARYYIATDEGNLTHLVDAANLNPYDSSLEMRIARVSAQAGHSDEALAAAARAEEVNPSNPIPQEWRARMLIEAGRYDEAYAHYQQMLTRFPRNTDALVNSGLLAIRLGHSDEAVEDWEKAIDIDPSQKNAQLYLAETLARGGQPAPAIHHFEAYSQLTANSPAIAPATNSPAPNPRAAVEVELGDAYALTRQSDQATVAYRQAAALAANSGDTKVQSLALAHLADALDSAGHPGDAAHAYQQALALDPRSGDALAAAADWFNYGQFLSRRNLPARLAYACFLHAEELLGATQGTELDTVAKTRRAAEARLGGEAAVVRKNLDATLAQAASLPESAFTSAH